MRIELTTLRIPGRIQMELIIPVEIFRKKSDTFRGIHFLLKRPKFSVPFFFIWITSARLHVERKRKIYRYFVNGTTQSRSCFRCQKKYQYHLTEIFHRNFRTNGKRSIMSNHLYMSQHRQHIILIYFRPLCVGPAGV